MKYNNEFKIVDTKEKAYLLGLLVADGCLFYNIRSGAYQVTIKLKESDKYLLDKISKIFPFFCIPKKEVRFEYNSYYTYCYSKEFYRDLELLGLCPRKSYENAEFVFLPELNDNLFFSYFLGLLDGDGSICQDSKGRIRIDLNGKNRNLFEEIKDKLHSLRIESKVYYREKRDIYMLRISKKQNVKDLIDRFKDNNLCLERKFKPYFNIDWNRIPGVYDGKRCKVSNILFVTRK